MRNVIDFIKWALTHIDPDETILEEAELPLPIEACGTEPWHYLYGTVKAHTTRAKIAERWHNYYKTHGWTKERYDRETASFREHDYATDCQGLCDAYLGTDINADMNFIYWCTDKGTVEDINRPYVIGEAVFHCNTDTGKMTHVGWVCGFDSNGEPLVVEARGLQYGVVVTKFSDRPWTHRGLMTKKFNYESEDGTVEQVILKKTVPMMESEAIAQLQTALNALGYDCGTADGKCGKKTMRAVEAFSNAHTTAQQYRPMAEFVDKSGDYIMAVVKVKE